MKYLRLNTSANLSHAAGALSGSSSARSRSWKQSARTERVLLRQSAQFYTGISNHLVENHGFVSLAVSQHQTNVSRTKLTLLGEQISGLGFVIRNFRTIRNARVIFAIGYIALTAKIMRRLGLLKYERLYWYPFFIISKSWYPMFRWLARLDTDRDTYIVSSTSELPLYEREMGIPRVRMAYLPFGDWQSDLAWDRDTSTSDREPYYFSGGATNRDYAALADAWRSIPEHRLVVVCSKRIKDFDSISFPPNVEIYKDISVEKFESLVSGAKACILPFKGNTGASGHSVFLQYMRKKKTVIVNRVDLVHEYFDHQVNGVIVEDIAKDIPAAIESLESTPQLLEKYGEAAFRSYKEGFSREIMRQRVSEIMHELPAAQSSGPR